MPPSMAPSSGISLSISIREPKHRRRDHETDRCISLSISIREPKLVNEKAASYSGISLSISIREPKHSDHYGDCRPVSVYQYPSENQNVTCSSTGTAVVSVYQYPSENQNIPGIRDITGKYQFINIHQRTKTARYSGSCGFGSIVSTKLYLKKIFGVKEMFVLHLFAAQQLHLGVLLFGN